MVLLLGPNSDVVVDGGSLINLVDVIACGPTNLPKAISDNGPLWRIIN